MKNLRKILCCVLSVLMLSGMLLTAPATANAAETNIQEVGATYSGTTGSCTWNLDTTTGVLSITGTGAMGDYSYSSDVPWYSYRSYVKTVSIANGVTSIGDYAFGYCTSLTSVAIPSSVTNIGGNAFSGCTSLTSVTITSSVTSIGSWAFEDCTSLTSITIPSSVTSIGNSVFSNCTSLTSVTIPSSVTSIGSDAFYWCLSLTSVTIPRSVTSIGDWTFAHCKSLTNVTIPNSVTSIGDYVFSNCSKLKTVYYTGTASEWSNISIGTDNTPLTNATIYYSVEETEASEPTEASSETDVSEMPSEIEASETEASETEASFETEATEASSETEATEPTKPTETRPKPIETQPKPTAPPVCRHNSTWIRGKKSATYFERGYTGDKICNNCGKVVSKGRSVAKKILATPKATIKSRGNSIVVSYTKVKNAQGFVINCKFGSQEYTKTVKTTKSKTITLSNIKRGIKAKIKVRAYTTSGKRKAYSGWTKAKTLKIK